jgi:hypothetical protein
MLLSGFSAARADVFNITYTGTVGSGSSAPVGNQLSGNDGFGFFGPPNSSLVGDTFTLVYTFDTSKGAFDITSWATQLYGGTGGTGNWPSPGFAVLTINGNSVTFGGNVVSQTQSSNSGGASKGRVSSAGWAGTWVLEPYGSSFIRRVDTRLGDRGAIELVG